MDGRIECVASTDARRRDGVADRDLGFEFAATMYGELQQDLKMALGTLHHVHQLRSLSQLIRHKHTGAKSHLRNTVA